jgi:hypothetical protein
VQRLRPGGGEDPALPVTLARALVYLSIAQNPGNPNSVGNYETGLKCAREAMEVLDSRALPIPETERLKLQFYARFGLVQSLYGLGRWEEGVLRSEDIEPILDQLERFPEESRWARRQRECVRGNCAYALLLAGHPNEVMERETARLNSGWTRTLPTNAWCNELECLAGARENLAVACGLGNRFDLMLPHTKEETNLWEQIVMREPYNAGWQMDRVKGWATHAWALMGTGHTNEGLALLEFSRREMGRLVEADKANDLFLSARAIVAGAQALAFAAWSRLPASLPERRDRILCAESYLGEAGGFSRVAKSKEAEAWVGLARAGVNAAKLKLEEDSGNAATP